MFQGDVESPTQDLIRGRLIEGRKEGIGVVTKSYSCTRVVSVTLCDCEKRPGHARDGLTRTSLASLLTFNSSVVRGDSFTPTDLGSLHLPL